MLLQYVTPTLDVPGLVSHLGQQTGGQKLDQEVR